MMIGPGPDAIRDFYCPKDIHAGVLTLRIGHEVVVILYLVLHFPDYCLTR